MNPSFSVSDFVAVFNQTIEYVYPSVTIVGELANYRVSKGKWIYFDLKDDTASIRFFGTIYSLPGPLEDGMVVQVVGAPKLHQTFGFSITVKSTIPVGEGSIKKATDLLRVKLTKEGLFDEERKRILPYPPSRIGLIASGQSAAYKDFVKILNARWGGIEIIHTDVQVQGETAPDQVVDALAVLNNTEAIDVIIITRGGGSPDDLVAFSNEQVVRAVASSRTPTMVAIGHEIDVSLSELAADQRASTPSNAAELLVPDKKAVITQYELTLKNSLQKVSSIITSNHDSLQKQKTTLDHAMRTMFTAQEHYIQTTNQILQGFDPRQILKRGYAHVKREGRTITTVSRLHISDAVTIRFIDGIAQATIVSTQQEV